MHRRHICTLQVRLQCSKRRSTVDYDLRETGAISALEVPS